MSMIERRQRKRGSSRLETKIRALGGQSDCRYREINIQLHSNNSADGGIR